jgi:hypothetical protein
LHVDDEENVVGSDLHRSLELTSYHLQPDVETQSEITRSPSDVPEDLSCRSNQNRLTGFLGHYIAIWIYR